MVMSSHCLFLGNYTTKKDVLPRFWKLKDEPDTLINRCLVLTFNFDQSLWNWDSCDIARPFICEFGNKNDTLLFVYLDTINPLTGRLINSGQSV